MDIPVKKLKDGFELPDLGLGTMLMGGKNEPDFSNDAAEIAAIKAAIEAGVTHIDTAEIYGVGHTEELIGKAIKGIKRSKLFITSKIWEPQSYENIITACKGSLKRLKTKYLDLYLLHQLAQAH